MGGRQLRHGSVAFVVARSRMTPSHFWRDFAHADDRWINGQHDVLSRGTRASQLHERLLHDIRRDRSRRRLRRSEVARARIYRLDVELDRARRSRQIELEIAAGAKRHRLPSGLHVVEVDE